MRRMGFVLLVIAVAGCGADRAHRPLVVPGDTWHAVLNDWYGNGKFDRPHSCVAVRAAMMHLPVDGPIYSTLGRDLRREEHKVCASRAS